VAVEIADERGVVAGIVVLADARRSLVDAAGSDGRRVEAIHRVA
jgi:hypothetical protein